MAVTVEFVTLGDASKLLKVKPTTLRLWTDELENYGVHYTQKNHRNERIYYESDLEIFAYMRDLKDEYKRTLKTFDVAMLIKDRGDKEGLLDLRPVEDAPTPEPSNLHLELLNQSDIKKLLESDRIRQFTGVIMDEVTKNIKTDLLKQMEDSMEAQRLDLLREMVDSHNKLEESIKERDKKWEEKMEARFNQTNELIAEWRKANAKPWWKKIFNFSD